MLRRDILDKLAALRRGLRRRLAAEGVSALAVVLVGIVFLTLGLDYWLWLERPARVVLLALGLAGLAAVVWRRLVAPMVAPMTTHDLALLVEDRFPQWGDRLISAVQFDQQGHAGTESAAMVARLIEQTNELAGGLDCRPIVERRTGRRAVLIALCSVGLLAGFSIWQGELMRCWLARNLAMANTPWPQEIYLKVIVPGQEGPDYVAVRGDDLKILVQAERTSPKVPWPTEINLHVEGWDSEKVEPADAQNGQYARTLRGVSEEFTFYVTCEKDKLDRRRPHHVRLIDPPALKDVQFVIRYPAYMVRDEPTETLSGPRSGIRVPVGGGVTVRATATKDIRLARMLLETPTGLATAEMTRELIDVPGEPGPRRRLLIGTFALPPGATALYRSLRIHLEDTEKASNARAASYRIDPRPDTAPEVRLTSYDIGRKITARATIPLGLAVKDDHGLTGVWVEADRKADFRHPARWTLLTTSDPPRQYSNPDLARAGDPAYPPFKLDLAPLAIKAEEQPDLYVRARAADNMPAAGFGGPNQALSDKVLIFTVAPDDVVMDLLLQRQHGLRVDLMAAREEQAKALAKTQAAQKAVAERPRMAELLDAAGRMEQTVAATSSRVADGLSQVLTEMKNNRLGNPKAYDLLGREIIEPLRGVAKDAVAVETDAQGAVQEAGAARGQARIAALVQAQQKILSRLDRILDTMEQAAGLQEAINRATIIRKALEEIQEKTRKWLEEELRGIVQPASTQPAAPPTTREGP